MTDPTTLLAAIDATALARVAGGLRSGDGGCIRPVPPTPFPPQPPQTPFDPKKFPFPIPG